MLRFAVLGGDRGVWQRDEAGELIVLDSRLSRRARRCVLAHELVHAERGIGHGAASPLTMAREEEIVRREVARRLVPPEALRALAAGALDGDGLDAAAVADTFDVETDVALEALRLLGAAPPPDEGTHPHR